MGLTVDFDGFPRGSAPGFNISDWVRIFIEFAGVGERGPLSIGLPLGLCLDLLILAQSRIDGAAGGIFEVVPTNAASESAINVRPVILGSDIGFASKVRTDALPTERSLIPFSSSCRSL